MTFAVADLKKCAEREVALRRAVYPKMIERGKISADKAEQEIAMMEDIARRIETVAAIETLALRIAKLVLKDDGASSQ